MRWMLCALLVAGCTRDAGSRFGQTAQSLSPSACGLEEACSEGDTRGCPMELACANVVAIGMCACESGQWACEPACSDGLCTTAAVQQAIVGTWTGDVTPPSFANPYTVTLTIGADGVWSGVASRCTDWDPNPCATFYYGDNGGLPSAKIEVQAQTSVGAWARISLFNDLAPVDGMLQALHVDDHHLTFTFVPSWGNGDCGGLFRFDLRR